jgi:phosphatidylinositol alpha-1,6-mannosyltransferase
LRRVLSTELGIDLNKKRILLSVGRLVERKGIHWFVRDVMPAIVAGRGDCCVYLIVGQGAYHGTIRQVIRETGLEEHIFMLGHVSDEVLSRLYNIADIFVMPNVPVEGDMEGFGLVALEAASCELPVVASRLEGIEEAIEDRESGFLVEPSDAHEFASIINWLLEDNARAKEFGKKVRSSILANYGWGGICQRYLEEFLSLQGQRGI